MGGMVALRRFWRGKRIFVTGHTGFKGGWLCTWLSALDAQVTGFALPPPTAPNIFTLAGVQERVRSVIGDVRDLPGLLEALRAHHPDIVFHLAAQSLVRRSYADPVGTFGTNVMGTVNLLEAVRKVDSVRVVINVTSDKCYGIKSPNEVLRETDPLGGSDPYSASKACAEMVALAYSRSYLPGGLTRQVAVASTRAGNVIGGGDWAEHRLVPDLVRSFTKGEPAAVRNPDAVRPWQHVLEPLYGYLLLAEHLWSHACELGGGWNFGPASENAETVAALVQLVAAAWGDGVRWVTDQGHHPQEARYLRLDSSKAKAEIGWRSRLTLREAVKWSVDWYKQCYHGSDMRDMTHQQINSYETLIQESENER